MYFLLCIVFIVHSTFATPNGLQEGVADGGQAGNPGVKLRVTQNGLDYLNEVMIYEMNTIIPRIRMDDYTHKKGQMYIRVTNAKVTNYKAPDSQSLKLKPSDEIVFSTRGADVAVKGFVQGGYGAMHDKGDVTISAENVDFTVTIHPLKQSNGQFGAQTRDCQANIGKLDFNIVNTGMLGKMLQQNKRQIINKLQGEFGKKLCEKVRKFVDESASQHLLKMPTKVPLNRSHSYSEDEQGSGGNGNGNRNHNGNGNSNKGRATSKEHMEDSVGGKALTNNITQHLYFDYSNLRDPSVTKDCVETQNKGEISYHGQGGTPFFPADLKDPHPPPATKMLYLVGSDYVLNSMFFQAFEHDLLKHRVEADGSSDLKSYLRTTCPEDICLGSIVPEIQKSFPDSQAEILLEAANAPAVIFRNGKVDMSAPMTVSLFAKQKNSQQRKTMAIADVDMKSSANLFFREADLSGTAIIDKFDMKMKQNNLKGFDQQRQDQLSQTAKGLLQNLMNAYLKYGIKMPGRREYHYKNMKLNVYERTVMAETDVEVDKQELTKSFARSMQKHGLRVEGYEN